MITQKMSQSAVQGWPRIMATFSHVMPSAIMPTKFSIQYTTKEPRPYADALKATSTGDAGGCENGIWNASETIE